MIGRKYLGRILVPKKNTPDHDIVLTPNDLAKEIITYFNPSGFILDPCKGEGSFYNNYPEYCKKDWCEILYDRNFFEYKTNVDWIITNPPWSKFRQFLNHSMSLSKNIIFLATINHFMTKARMRDIKQNKFYFAEIYGVHQPTKNWPSSGFQLAAIHIKKIDKSKNDCCKFSGIFKD